MEFIFFILTVLFISLSGVLAPGPLFAATIAEGKTNRFAGILIAFGHAAVEIPIILLLFFFGAFIATDLVKPIIGFFGGIVMMYLAYTEFRSKKSVKPAKGIITGILMSSLNPYFIIWWLTIGFKLVIDSISFGIIGLIAFILAHEICDFSWLGFISFSSNKSTQIWGENAFKAITALSITILIFFGAYFIYIGLVSLVSLI